ncbi:hypothetical protein LTR78_003040 [Recurvomyces mirabilis]|uniref:Uncharacterized protein n=1 Tax=Recurvomyces mirabilis TaxID=574656 RepID=A0AAE1C3R1_9PEZI|nr:hypothetical protein LTR78_003040 [Recurvomyces mirabilis]KAK5157138.1 hypothetical protein LTS14_004656 [Recurvomyces mirabilis]
MIELQKRPDIEKHGRVCAVQDRTVWQDSRMFRCQLREGWNGAASDNDGKGVRQAWNNINAFAAQLVATSHSQSQDKPDLSLYCIWTVRTALEDSDDQPEHAALSAGSLCSINAAPAIWNLCGQEATFDGKLAKPRSQYGSDKWRGFTRDRWRSWNKKLRGFQGQISNV